MNDTVHPSTLRVHAEAMGVAMAGAEEVRAHLTTCATCQALVAQYRQEQQELLHRWPSPDALAARRPPRPSRWALGWLVPVAAAAAAMILVTLQTPEPSDERVKSAAGIQLAVVRDGVAEPFHGQPLRTDDLLGFRYTSSYRFLTVVMIEESGQAQIVIPAAGAALPITPGTNLQLPQSIVLDAYRGRERVLALFTDEPLDAPTLLATIEARLQALDPEARARLELGTLPVAGDQHSWLLEKEQP